MNIFSDNFPVNSRIVEVELMDSNGVFSSISMVLNSGDTSSKVVEIEAGREYSLTSSEFQNPTIVIDGGAGYGEFAIECAQKGAIQVHAFEPNPIFKKLMLDLSFR